MTNEEKIKIAELCGLSYSGKDDEDQDQFIGTIENCHKFDEDLINKDELEEKVVHCVKCGEVVLGDEDSLCGRCV